MKFMENDALNMKIKLAQLPEILTEGESLRQGKSCVFLRTIGCNCRCNSDKYEDCKCDSEYTFNDTENTVIMSVREIIEYINKLGCKNLSITGGEPLLHKKEIYWILYFFDQQGYDITIETNGSIDFGWIIENFPKVHIIGDWKCPVAFGEATHSKMLESNLYLYRKNDALKFVVAAEDLEEVKRVLERSKVYERTNIYLSPCWGVVKFKTISDWINNHLKYNAILSIQQHKLLDAEIADIKKISDRSANNIHL